MNLLCQWFVNVAQTDGTFSIWLTLRCGVQIHSFNSCQLPNEKVFFPLSSPLFFCVIIKCQSKSKRVISIKCKIARTRKKRRLVLLRTLLTRDCCSSILIICFYYKVSVCFLAENFHRNTILCRLFQNLWFHWNCVESSVTSIKQLIKSRQKAITD